MEPIRVLIADDSALARELIISILSMDKQLRVVGEARDGKEAVEKTRDLKPDIITMDIEMPVMTGIEAIEHIMAENAVPILVVTSRSDAHTAYTAVSKGALDLVPKPEVSLDCAHEFTRKVKLVSQIKVITHMRRHILREHAVAPVSPQAVPAHSNKIIAIASSTGGPHALSGILSRLPETFPCPVVIAQHIPDGFVKGLADWLGKSLKLRLKVAEQGEPLSPGRIYLAPSESHMEVAGGRISFVERRPDDIYHPSCDILLSSVAREYGGRGIGIILTGMGSDGAMGMKKIKEAGGVTIAQDEETSVVFGMNKVAIDSGGADRVLALERIGPELIRLASA
ncbi:MAG: chemotaxis-specific protein-glutamate methyltransferase CheB [Nitrospirota bacterium]